MGNRMKRNGEWDEAEEKSFERINNIYSVKEHRGSSRSQLEDCLLCNLGVLCVPILI